MSCLVSMLFAKSGNARGWARKVASTTKGLHGLFPPLASQTRHMQRSSRTEDDDIDNALD
eukprot:4284618-Pyramimonas_sp.AAC.1